MPWQDGEETAMRLISHALALTATAIRGIPERLGTSLVTIISITTVMAVLVTMLALGEGVQYLSQNGARKDGRLSSLAARNLPW